MDILPRANLDRTNTALEWGGQEKNTEGVVNLFFLFMEKKHIFDFNLQQLRDQPN
jgi:hypothetical protein